MLSCLGEGVSLYVNTHSFARTSLKGSNWCTNEAQQVSIEPTETLHRSLTSVDQHRHPVSLSHIWVKLHKAQESLKPKSKVPNQSTQAEHDPIKSSPFQDKSIWFAPVQLRPGSSYLPSISPPGAEILDMHRWVVPMMSLGLPRSLDHENGLGLEKLQQQ